MPSYEPDKKKNKQNLADVLRSKLGYAASHNNGKPIGDFNATHVKGEPIGTRSGKPAPQISPGLLESLKRKVAGPTSVSTTAAPTMTGGRSSIPPGVTPTKPTPLVPPAPGRGPGGRQVDPGFYRDDPRKRKPRNPSTVSTSRYPR